MKNTLKFMLGLLMAASIFSCEKDVLELDEAVGKPVASWGGWP